LDKSGFIYGCLGLDFGVLGMTFANSFLNGDFGMWMHGGPWGRTPFGPNFGPAFFHFIWLMIILRSGLAFAAGYGLMERALGAASSPLLLRSLISSRFPLVRLSVSGPW
jgi:hypothetical protein